MSRRKRLKITLGTIGGALVLFALGGLCGIAIAFKISHAHAAEIHCQRTATREFVCDKDVSAYRNAVGETVFRRQTERLIRCARAATDEVCRHD